MQKPDWKVYVTVHIPRASRLTNLRIKWSSSRGHSVPFPFHYDWKSNGNIQIYTLSPSESGCDITVYLVQGRGLVLAPFSYQRKMCAENCNQNTGVYLETHYNTTFILKVGSSLGLCHLYHASITYPSEETWTDVTFLKLNKFILIL